MENLTINGLIIYILLFNIIGFVQMYMDKKFAVRHRRRISEKRLMLTAFFGGALGTWLSMYLNHHKTMKLKFKIGVPILAIFNICIYSIIYKDIVYGF